MSSSDLGFRTWWIRRTGRPAIYRVASGSLVNALGSGATAVAFGFFLYDRTGSAGWLSALDFFSFGITGVFTPLAGGVADPDDRQKLIIAANIGAAMCSLALITARGPVALVSIAFVASVVGRAGSPSFGAALPNLVGDEPLEWANGTLSVAYNIGNLLGPILGGAVYVAAGRSVVFAFDAATYLVAAVAVSSLRVPFRATDEHGALLNKERTSRAVACSGASGSFSKTRSFVASSRSGFSGTSLSTSRSCATCRSHGRSGQVRSPSACYPRRGAPGRSSAACWDGACA